MHMTTGHVLLKQKDKVLKSPKTMTTYKGKEITETNRHYFCGTDWHSASEQVRLLYGRLLYSMERKIESMSNISPVLFTFCLCPSSNSAPPRVREVKSMSVLVSHQLDLRVPTVPSSPSAFLIHSLPPPLLRR